MRVCVCVMSAGGVVTVAGGGTAPAGARVVWHLRVCVCVMSAEVW